MPEFMSFQRHCAVPLPCGAMHGIPHAPTSHTPQHTAQAKQGQSMLHGHPQHLTMHASGAGITSVANMPKVWWPVRMTAAFVKSGSPSLCTFSCEKEGARQRVGALKQEIDQSCSTCVSFMMALILNAMFFACSSIFGAARNASFTAVLAQPPSANNLGNEALKPKMHEKHISESCAWKGQRARENYLRRC
jgi:hypothetical protein